MQYIKCNHCGKIQSEEELLIVGDDVAGTEDEACIGCKKVGGLMDIEKCDGKHASPIDIVLCKDCSDALESM